MAFPPRINDVSTDVDDPPAIVAGPSRGYDPVLPSRFRQAIRTTYADLAPLRIPEPPEIVFRRALEVARTTPRWTITREDPLTCTFEAVATTRILRFQDDVVVRVRTRDTGSIVDVRSRSRVGRGDLGANAARIRAFLAALRAASPAAR